MKKLMKAFGILLGLLVLVVIALAVAVPLMFDINDHKERIAAEVHAETGRTLTIDGDLELTVFPWLGVRSGAMSLSQADGFGDEPFAAFTSAEARVRLMPLLLRREVEIGRIAFSGLRVRLEVDADGRDNWSDLADAGDDDETMERDTDDGDPWARLESFTIEGIVLEDATIVYRDARAGTVYTIEGLDLETGALRLDHPLEIGLKARFSSAVPQLRGDLEWSGRVDLDTSSKDLTLMMERARADLGGGVLPAERMVVLLAGTMKFNTESRRFSSDNLQADIMLRGGRFPDADHDIRIVTTVQGDLGAQTLVFGPARMDGLGMVIDLEGRGERILDAPAFDGRVDIRAFSPRALLGTLGVEVPETADASALTHLQLAGAFTATQTSVSVTGLTARLDDTTMSGRFAVADFERQALRFDLTLDGLDLDRYLPPGTAPTDDAPVNLDAIEIPEAVVRKLDLDGSLRIGTLKAAGMASEDIRVTMNAGNGVLRIHPASARMYGGTYTGDISVDVRRGTPVVSMDERMSGIQSGLLFKDLFAEERISGTADLTARLSGEGTTVGQLRRTLAGRVEFSFRDGEVHGFDLWHRLRDARAVLRRETRPVKTGPEVTPFGSLVGSGVVERGVLRNDDLVANLPFLRITGRGTADLAAETIDYRVQVVVLDRPGVEGTTGMRELVGKTIPVVISGPFDDLSIGVDIASVLQQEIRDRIEDKIEGKIEDEIEKRARDLLDRLRR